MVKLPNLDGLTKEDAEILLQMNSINLGLVLYDSSVNDSTNASKSSINSTVKVNLQGFLGRR